MSSNIIEPITASFAAGEVKQFHVNGTYFELLDVPYTVDVKLLSREGVQLGLMKGGEASFFQRMGAGQEYNTIELTSQLAQVVKFFAGGGEAGTRRTAGVVTVIDGAKSRTMGNLVFGAAPIASALAANISYTQLWNPPLSGRRLIVSAVTMAGNPAALSLYVGIGNASIGGTDVTATRSRSNYGAPGVAGTVAQARAANGGALPLSVWNWSQVAAAGVVVRHEPKQGPYVLEPGFGLILATGTVQEDFYTSYEYQEELV